LSFAKQHQIALAALLALSLVLGWRPLFQTELLAAQNDQYTHILLILPISLWLIFLDLKSSRKEGSWSFRLGLPVLGAAILLAVYAYTAPGRMPADVDLAVQVLALVLSWIGIYVICCGIEVSRPILFPLLLLFALVPLPRSVLNPIIALLQVGSAWSAHILFAIFRIPAIQDGVQIAIPGLTLQVAQECSSIRSSSMLLVTAVILAQFFLRAFWGKALIALITIPLSVAKNGLRIFTIAMLGTRVDPGYLTGKLHHQGGILFFVLALACLFIAIWMCRRIECANRLVTSVSESLPEAAKNQQLVGVRDSDAT
jgi:exosortase